ncbi:MAG: TRAP transporter permease [Proteobacteria bacterium]|nr:TRAP transporter permease [Pseudomonadota bacterium]MBU1581264.1 TRAP transporter permease [Pseudomonadota bacterium]MBU2627131.1 TRAP transporter permease [Pseudomonadota bacterium]
MVSSIYKPLVSAVAWSMAAFHLYTGIFGIFESVLQRSTHVFFAMILVFLMTDIRGKSHAASPRWYDWLLILLTVLTVGYVAAFAGEIASRYSYVTPLSQYEIIAGCVGTLLLLEAARRNMGLGLPLIAAVFLGYVFTGQYLPGILSHQGFSLMWAVDHIFFTTEGIWGIPAGVSATFIVMFIIFAAFLEQSKGGDFFIDLSLGLFGKARGGPAKAAIFASGFMGMLSGSAVANVVTTGAFTIPLMKRLGYSARFSGAVESVASSGGQLMPPIMGAAAFIIAEFLGMPYIEVAAAASIPAFLYYLSAFSMVHFESLRIDMKGMKAEDLPVVRKTLVYGFQFILPVIVLVILLIKGNSPMRAGLWAILITILVSYVRTETRMTPKRILSALESGAKGAVQVGIACATAGIIIGVLTLTGLGMRFNSIILMISQGSLLLTLILTMFTSLLLGMGLPTVAAYIIQVSLTVPVLTQTFGVHPLSAHFFIFYFAIISAITPPVALAAYAAAGISGADPLKTAITSCRLGLAAFIVPYMFIYAPQLLMVGSIPKIILATISSIIGVIALAASVVGWLVHKAGRIERLFLMAAALCLIKPGLYTDLAGLAFLAVAFVSQYISSRSSIRSKTVLSK